ncbi:dipeptide-binding protein [Renibacterium salmoninarum ATCC 33209]|uniref:Dipeptide-binding protein n=1 Tax=Renibacterium salmoninarum (strain ATCC 33209 / DSM 20767 / JCM 11484 / NBRC 15589 / NCIMB 2235) TaxID=288705 RepID=A9WTB5_RENSM|nr:ABC transporter substrate-binding protein [Renibacterium salmoninarum]ABY24053.1 dipeptide-binding protein [Renibacterium salmoninarum ATCC 33209]
MRDPRKFRLLTGLCLVLLLALSACSAGYTASNRLGPPVGRPDGLSVALTSEPANLDFTTTAGAAIPQTVMYNVYEGLVKIDQQGQIQPLLAKSSTISQDRTAYTFALQPGVKFSNGAAFTAANVKFSIERVKSPAWLSSLKKKMDVVTSVEVIDDLHVTVQLAKPSNAWLYDMGTLIGAMFDPASVDKLASKAIGTGPFVISQWNHRASIEMDARPDYWGSSAKVKHVSLRYFSDAVATTNALKSGDVDLVYNMQAPDMVQSSQQRQQVPGYPGQLHQQSHFVDE